MLVSRAALTPMSPLLPGEGHFSPNYSPPLNWWKVAPSAQADGSARLAGGTFPLFNFCSLTPPSCHHGTRGPRILAFLHSCRFRLRYSLHFRTAPRRVTL